MQNKIILPKPVLLMLTLLPAVPFIILITQGVMNQLGADPGKTLVHSLGLWALRFLLLTLSITPLQRFTPLHVLRLRRTFGLYALGYAVLHLLGYAFFYLGFDLALLGSELIKRPYIVVGSTALLMLSMLGVTSTRSWQKRLGRRWKTLHQLVYLIVVLVIIHYAWQVKTGFGAAPWYALAFAVLMALRWRR
jgi:sulfoxide reductase heme-binding subunit YedZ